jgi:hypothetical protein
MSACAQRYAARRCASSGRPASGSQAVQPVHSGRHRLAAVHRGHRDRDLLLRFLNAWGCRIRYPRDGEPAPFGAALSAWWQSWQPALPRVSLLHMSESDIGTVAVAYAALAAVPVSGGQRRRSLGPTGAAKALYALRPESVAPWDAAIAVQTQGGRDEAAFGRHLRLCRMWAAALIAETGASETELPALAGRPAVPLTKILDEYLYVTFTLKASDFPFRAEEIAPAERERGLATVIPLRGHAGARRGRTPEA